MVLPHGALRTCRKSLPHVISDSRGPLSKPKTAVQRWRRGPLFNAPLRALPQGWSGLVKPASERHASARRFLTPPHPLTAKIGRHHCRLRSLVRACGCNGIGAGFGNPHSESSDATGGNKQVEPRSKAGIDPGAASTIMVYVDRRLDCASCPYGG